MKKSGKRKIDTVEKLATLMVGGFSDVSERFDTVDEELRSIRSELSDIHRRISRLEEQGASQAGYAKEIDYLLARVSKIEKHLHLA